MQVFVEMYAVQSVHARCPDEEDWNGQPLIFNYTVEWYGINVCHVFFFSTLILICYVLTFLVL